MARIGIGDEVHEGRRDPFHHGIQARSVPGRVGQDPRERAIGLEDVPTREEHEEGGPQRIAVGRGIGAERPASPVAKRPAKKPEAQEAKPDSTR